MNSKGSLFAERVYQVLDKRMLSSEWVALNRLEAGFV